MKAGELEEVLRSLSDSFVVDSDESWEISVDGTPMHVFISQSKDRMRLVGAVCYTADLSPEDQARLLRANFHLDARYASYGDTLHAVFAHSLSGLRESDARSAARQIAELMRTFDQPEPGGRLHFQWPRPDPLKASGGGVRRRTIEAVRDSRPRRIRDEDTVE